MLLNTQRLRTSGLNRIHTTCETISAKNKYKCRRKTYPQTSLHQQHTFAILRAVFIGWIYYDVSMMFYKFRTILVAGE